MITNANGEPNTLRSIDPPPLLVYAKSTSGGGSVSHGRDYSDRTRVWQIAYNEPKRLLLDNLTKKGFHEKGGPGAICVVSAFHDIHQKVTLRKRAAVFAAPATRGTARSANTPGE
ncbi:hypothetical protein SDC9_190902 [bioreactor metagenome]|uniref:Uncharacterized protein n=1 Tax=bioreactor metagenome TaxID=1076179 RepID=A0A645I7C9_9ZZZZ